MNDGDLAQAVARDLTRYLSDWAERNTETVFALALWINEPYAEFGIGIGTEEWFRQAKAPDQDLDGPNFRWSSGSWDIIAESFLSDETEELLSPLAEVLNDDGLPEETVAEASRQWHDIGYEAVKRTAIPPAMPSALLFGECDGMHCLDIAEGMLNTIPATRFHAAIPAWRRLAEAVRSRPDASDELTRRLTACGLEMDDVTNNTDRLERALAIADATGPILGQP